MYFNSEHRGYVKMLLLFLKELLLLRIVDLSRGQDCRWSTVHSCAELQQCKFEQQIGVNEQNFVSCVHLMNRQTLQNVLNSRQLWELHHIRFLGGTNPPSPAG